MYGCMKYLLKRIEIENIDSVDRFKMRAIRKRRVDVAFVYIQMNFNNNVVLSCVCRLCSLWPKILRL